jgi:hypothetical protein
MIIIYRLEPADYEVEVAGPGFRVKLVRGIEVPTGSIVRFEYIGLQKKLLQAGIIDCPDFSAPRFFQGTTPGPLDRD